MLEKEKSAVNFLICALLVLLATYSAMSGYRVGKDLANREVNQDAVK